MQVIENVKDTFLKFKNGTKEARYKAILKANGVFSSLLRFLRLLLYNQVQ